MSKQARRFQPKNKRPIDRKVHSKTGRRKGEKLRQMLKVAR